MRQRWPAILSILFALLLPASALAQGQAPSAHNAAPALAPLPVPAAAPRDRLFGVAEAFRDLGAASEAGASWERLVFSWQYIQWDAPDGWNAGYFPDREMKRLQDAGFEVVGLIQDTPEWARLNPEQGATSVPINLELPWDHPDNVWGQFVYRLALQYRGRVNHWIVWNEPEFQPNDQGGLYVTFSGSEADYYQMLKVAYRAAKAANPDATVVFGATSYWIDRVNGRDQFLARVLDIAATDPDAAEWDGFFDAVALNIYWSADDVRRVGLEYGGILARHGLAHKRLWITETNSMPWNDPVEPKPRNGQRVTLEEQAAFAIQAYATAIATGYERVGWHATIDRDTVDEIWGLARNDGTRRPVHAAYQVASTWLSHALASDWLPVERETWAWTSNGDYSNVRLYRVVVARPAKQRVSVLWNGDGFPYEVRVPRRGSTARVVDKRGLIAPAALDVASNSWVLTLPGATAHAPIDPPGFFYTGGDPLLLVEENVPDEADTGDLVYRPLR